jgi:hypothetical protein
MHVETEFNKIDKTLGLMMGEKNPISFVVVQTRDGGFCQAQGSHQLSRQVPHSESQWMT